MSVQTEIFKLKTLTKWSDSAVADRQDMLESTPEYGHSFFVIDLRVQNTVYSMFMVLIMIGK